MNTGLNDISNDEYRSKLKEEVLADIELYTESVANKAIDKALADNADEIQFTIISSSLDEVNRYTRELCRSGYTVETKTEIIYPDLSF